MEKSVETVSTFVAGTGLTVFDLVILAIIGVFAAIGFIRGFIRELAALTGLLVGIILVAKFAVPLGSAIPPASIPLLVRIPIAGIIIMIAVAIVAKLMAYAIRKILVHGPLKLLDRIFGTVFGALKGLILILVFLFIILVSPLESSFVSAADKSVILKPVFGTAKPLVDGYKDSFYSAISNHIAEMTIGKNALTDSNRQEIVHLIKKIDKAGSIEEKRQAIQNLSPSAKKFIADLCQRVDRDSEGSFQDEKSLPFDLKWLHRHLPLDLIREEVNKLTD